MSSTEYPPDLESLEDSQANTAILAKAHAAHLALARRFNEAECGRFDDYVNALLDAGSALEYIGNQLDQEVSDATPAQYHRHPDTGQILAQLA